MNNKFEIKSNTEEVFEQLKDFTLKEVKNVQKSALRKIANILKTETKKNLRRALPKSKNRNPKYNDKLIDGVKSSVNKAGTVAKTHVMGSRKKGSGTFRLRFFEAGTVTRKTRKGYNRGKLKALYFFKTAIPQAKQKQINAIDEAITKKIEQINKKKFNSPLK